LALLLFCATAKVCFSLEPPALAGGACTYGVDGFNIPLGADMVAIDLS
jgi:hypothetical protein